MIMGRHNNGSGRVLLTLARASIRSAADVKRNPPEIPQFRLGLCDHLPPLAPIRLSDIGSVTHFSHLPADE